MKTSGNLWPHVIEFPNLTDAARKASLGKRDQPIVVDFLFNLERECFRLREELATKTYLPGPYHSFWITDPKPRMISAAPFRDRVVHHALVAVIAPLLERRLIHDCWANREGKGTHRAVARFQEFCRRYRYCLKCDAVKYFPSIDHDILKAKVRRAIRCPNTLWLTDLIIDRSNPQEEIIRHFPGDDLFTPLQRRRGLPIGNLTSQWLANFYLDDLDHFAKETLRCPAYLRYVDDFALFSDDKHQLRAWRGAIIEKLAADRLTIHEHRARPYRTADGLSFLGFRIWPHRRRLVRGNVVKARRRLKDIQRDVGAGILAIPEAGDRLRCWLAHADQGDTRGLIEEMLEGFVLVAPGGAGEAVPALKGPG